MVCLIYPLSKLNLINENHQLKTNLVIFVVSFAPSRFRKSKKEDSLKEKALERKEQKKEERLKEIEKMERKRTAEKFFQKWKESKDKSPKEKLVLTQRYLLMIKCFVLRLFSLSYGRRKY